MGLCDGPFDRSTQRQHADTGQISGRTAAEFGQPIIVDADAFSLVLGVGNPKECQAETLINNFGLNVVEPLINDSCFEIEGSGAGFLVAVLLPAFDVTLLLVVNHRPEQANRQGMKTFDDPVVAIFAGFEPGGPIPKTLVHPSDPKISRLY